RELARVQQNASHAKRRSAGWKKLASSATDAASERSVWRGAVTTQRDVKQQQQQQQG
ncbi:unnamed protein product, partial [Ceratitis capitata]